MLHQNPCFLHAVWSQYHPAPPWSATTLETDPGDQHDGDATEDYDD